MSIKLKLNYAFISRISHKVKKDLFHILQLISRDSEDDPLSSSVSSINPSDELKSPLPIDLDHSTHAKSDLNSSIVSDQAHEPPQEDTSFEEVLDTPEELKTPEEIKSIDNSSPGKLH